MGQQPTPVPAEKMEYWREMRSLIMHEDNLVNHRFSWLLTYEGFLMGGFFLVQSGILSNKVSASVVVAAELFLLPIMLASMWICFITGQTISAAYRQTAIVNNVWIRRYKEEEWKRSSLPHWFRPFTTTRFDLPIDPPDGSEFPPILGRFSYRSVGKTVRIPFILCMINLLGVVMCVGIAWYAHSNPATPAALPPSPQAEQHALSNCY